MSLINRWRFEATIITNAPLHIGNGETTERKEMKKYQGKDPDIASVSVDAREKAYLPGKSIKGAIRSWLDHYSNVRKDLINSLFGSEETKENRGMGGKAEFQDAFYLRHDPSAENFPYWCAKRLTGVITRTNITRCSRTVRKKMLLNEEFVPPGVSFKVVLTGSNLSKEEASLLLFSIKGFSHPEFPIRLGANEQNLRGSFNLDDRSIRIFHLDDENVNTWLKSQDLPSRLENWQVRGGGYDCLPDFTRTNDFEQYIKFWTICPPPRFEIKLGISFDSAFMVHDPGRRIKINSEAVDTDYCAMLDTQGRILLPADSLRGALRSQAEKILRTMNIHACDPQESSRACKAIYCLNDKCTLCPSCQLFGASGWASSLQFSDFLPTQKREGSPIKQEFVAIDRFTGGTSGGRKFDSDDSIHYSAEDLKTESVSGGKKFNAKPFWNSALEGDLILELDRAEPWSLGLIALTLRDLIEGDVRLGFGAGKGYGSCTARIMKAKIYTKEEDMSPWKGLAEVVGKLNHSTSDPWAKLDLQPFVNKLREAIAKKISPFDKQAIQNRILEPSPNSSTSPKTFSTIQNVPIPDDPFYHPFHFVPVEGTNGRYGDVSAEAFFTEEKMAIGHITHDRYVDGKFSGRILCALTAEDPIVIGANQDENQDKSHKIAPFILKDRPAIPASSLKGLFSSIAEAASNSALRVLHDRSFSIRMKMPGLPAIGMIREVSRNGMKKLELQPLTLPPTRWDAYKNQSAAKNDNLNIFEKCNLQCYINGYSPAAPAGITVTTGSFLDAPKLVSYSSDHKEYWWARVKQFGKFTGKPIASSRDGIFPHIKANYLIGQDLPQGEGIKSQKEYDSIKSPSEKNAFKRGILRILGFKGHEEEIPKGKKHEIFIPFSNEQESKPQTFDIDEPIRIFYKIAEERSLAEDYLPFHLKGSMRNSKKKGNRIELRDGDLVFFKAKENKIVEISLSSIWRRDKNSVYAYFTSISPELLPMNRNRKTISLAEQLFGFVEEDGKDENTESADRAYAGRVLFSFGILSPSIKEEEFYQYNEAKRLKILSSPKPPCPVLYFKSENGYISKEDLEPGRQSPQGRKFYLHKSKEIEEPWLAPNLENKQEDKNSKQRLWANPLKENSVFYFHVDFANLSEDELALLCYALKPTEVFRHKIGFGKPIGLGKIRIDPLGIFFIQRNDRYLADCLTDGRYHTIYRESGFHNKIELPPQYRTEKDLLCSHKPVDKELSKLEALRSSWRIKMDTKIRWALELIGDPDSIKAYPVHYPKLRMMNGSLQNELKLFRWFVENECDKHFLPPIEENKPLPRLRYIKEPIPGRRTRN
jgi:CRISPR-associated protein (TIGR03986 family)